MESVGARSARAVRRVALVLVAVLAATTAVVSVPGPAMAAAEGKVRKASVRIVNDGTSVAPGDTSPSDGVVGIGGKVIFDWSFDVSAVHGSTVTQTLPEGWSWDYATIDPSGGNNTTGLHGYTARMTTVDVGRTLQLTLDSAVALSGVQHLEFTGMTAVVNRTKAQLGVVYTPTLKVSDGAGTRDDGTAGSPGTVTVAGIRQVDLQQSSIAASGGLEGEYDFGNGPEKAVQTRISVNVVQQTAVGNAPIQWPGALTVDESLLWTTGGTPVTDTGYAIDPVVDMSSSATGLTASLQRVDLAAGAFQVVFRDIPAGAATLRADVVVWVPRAKVPNVTDPGNQPLRLSAVAAIPGGADAWKSADGEPLTDFNPNNNEAVANYSVKDPLTGTRPIQSLYRLRAELLASSTGANLLDGASVLPGTFYAGEAVWTPAMTQAPGSSEWVPDATSNLRLTHFWNPKETKFHPELGFYVRTYDNSGAPIVQVEDVDYVVYYTTDQTTWVKRSDYHGSIDDVRGVMFAYIANGGVFAPGPVTNLSSGAGSWMAGMMFEAIRDIPADPQVDLGQISHLGGAYGREIGKSLYVRAGSAALAIYGRPGGESGQYVYPGQRVDYELRPEFKGLNASPAGNPNMVVPGVKLTVCLPPELLADTLDFGATDSAEWEVAEVVPKHPSCSAGKGTRIAFTYLGEAHYISKLPYVTFGVTAGDQIPVSGVLEASSVLQARGVFGPNGQDAATAKIQLKSVRPKVAQFEKTTSTPQITAGDPIEYALSWANLMVLPTGESVLMDVLPYDGDGRGTVLHGGVELESAALNADSALGARLQLTTDPGVRGTGAPGGAVPWIAYDAATPAQLASATAIRVVMPTLVAGDKSKGTLSYVLRAPGAVAGDRIENSASGDFAGGAVPLGEADPVTTIVRGADVSAWSLTKTADPASGSMVLPGSGITYTLTVHNSGTVPVTGVTVHDDLRDVLDHATLTGALPAGVGWADGRPELGLLEWKAPAVAPGASASVSFQVDVDPGAASATLTNHAYVVAGPDGQAGCGLDEDHPCETVHTTYPLPVLPSLGGLWLLGSLAIGAGLLAVALLLTLRRNRAPKIPLSSE